VLRSLRQYIEVLYSSEYLFTDLPWVLSGGGDMSCYIMYVCVYICMYACAHTHVADYNACMVPNVVSIITGVFSCIQKCVSVHVR
jgi:hypothetical protein